MTRGEKKQTRRMRWILFSVFVTLYVVIVILTTLALFFDVVSLKPKHEDLLVPAFILEIAGVVVAMFKANFIWKKKPGQEVEEKLVPRVGGKYKYEIKSSDKKSTYQGECLVEQDGRALAFNGEQKKEVVRLRKKKVSFHWFSHWAELCVDNKVRVDYSLSNNNGGMRCYAVLQIGSRSPKTMKGELHLFGDLYTFGTIRLKRA
jgi:hypothetical protein